MSDQDVFVADTTEMDSGAGTSFLPPFANAENKALDAQVQRLEKQLQQVDAALEEHGGRVGVMHEHLKNVQQELTYTESRVEAENKEIETENHLKQLAERELGRVVREVEKLGRERLEVQDKVLSLQQQIYKGTEKLDQFKLLMNWNQEELDQWGLAQRQKEEDNAALDKYRRQDQGKMKELDLHVLKLTQEVVTKRAELETEVTETQAAQIQLDRVADDFRKLHEERRELVQKWDEAIEAMRRKDEAIRAATEVYAEKKLDLRQRKIELDAQARFLQNEVVNNKELEARITIFERDVAKRRDAMAAEQGKLSELSAEVDLMQVTVAKAANDLAQQTVENSSAHTELEKKRKRLDLSRKQYAALRQRLDTEFGLLDSVEAKIAELESIRRSEEVRLKGLQKEHEEMRKEHLKQTQALFQLRRKEQDLISEIAGGQGQNKNLAARIVALDAQVVRQQELLYTVEFALQEMERKLARAKGQRTDEEAKALTARIDKLTTILEGVNVEYTMLVDQVKQAEEDLLQARQRNAVLVTDRARVDEKIAGLKLETESSTRQLKVAVADKERAAVEHDVMKLEVKRLRDILNMRADEVYSLEARRLQLKTSMEERRHEIEVQRDGLRSELRMLKDDIHRVTLELKERALKVDKLAAKYEILSTKGRATEDDGEVKSQAYYVIKAAQEREELQRAGDALDSQIRRAEKECAGLETTLGQLMNVNTSFTQSLRKGPGTAAVSDEKVALRARLDKVYDKLKLRRGEEAAALSEVQQTEAQLRSVAAEHSGLQAQIAELCRRKADADKQLEEQQDKAQRAKQTVARLTRQLRARVGGDAAAGDSAQEKDIAVGDLRETNRAMLAAARALAAAVPDAGVAEAFAEAGLKLPSGPGSNAGSVATSRQPSRAASYASSERSAENVSVRSSTSKAASRPASVKTMQLGI